MLAPSLARRLGLALLPLALTLAQLFSSPLALAHVEGGSPGNPAPAGSGATAGPTVSVPSAAHIRDRTVFAVKVAWNGHSAAERAQHASEVLEHAVDDSGGGEARVEQHGDVAVVYVDASPVIQLGPDDALAEGDASVAVHAAVVAAHVNDALHAERRRSALAKSVFSISLLVFSALMVFLVLVRLASLVDRMRAWVASSPSTIPAIRIAGMDVLRPTALRSVALGGIDGSRWLLRLGIVYVWLLFALSLFDMTRAYSERLTGFVLAPLSGFVGRLTATMPVLLIGAVAAVVVLLTLRVIGLFFDGVTRGEPSLSWLPADLAGPTSILVRIGVVVVACSVATPLIGGSDEGPLARVSVIAIAAVAVALTPMLASAVVGVSVLFGRQLKIGDFVELGPRHGSVRALTLLAVVLEDADGCKVHVPHLASLIHPTRVKGPVPPVLVEISIDPRADFERVSTILGKVAGEVGLRGRVTLLRIDALAAVYEITVLSPSATVRGDLLVAATKALRDAGIVLAGGASERHAGAGVATAPQEAPKEPPGPRKTLSAGLE